MARKELTKESAEKWLDKIIKLQKQLNKARILTDDIYVCSENNNVHIYSGLEQVAEVLGVEYNSREWDVKNSSYDEELYFTYKGVEVIQLGRTDAKDV